MTYLKSYRYYNYAFLPQGFDLIENYELSKQNIVIPSSITEFKDCYFLGCLSFAQITYEIPSSVT